MSVRNSGGEPIVAGEVLSRVFSAPRGLVFEVWTKAEHFMHWFGPHGAEVLGCELDARPGGVIRFEHRFSGQVGLHVQGTFVEVVRDERLVLTFGFVDEHGHPIGHPMFPDWPLEVLIEMTVTFVDIGEGTRVTVAHGVLPPEAASHPATKRWSPLALEGSRQVLERLGEYLSLAAERAARKEPTT